MHANGFALTVMFLRLAAHQTMLKLQLFRQRLPCRRLLPQQGPRRGSPRRAERNGGRAGAWLLTRDLDVLTAYTYSIAPEILTWAFPASIQGNIHGTS